MKHGKKTETRARRIRRDKTSAAGVIPDRQAPDKQINPAWTWYHQALLQLRERLLGDRGEQLRHAAEPLEPHSLHAADTATDEFDHDLALGSLSAKQDVLYEVDEAINRIRAGTYGICEKTGKRIAAARLRAIPWTRFVQRAEAELEREKMVMNRPALGRVGSLGESGAAGFMDLESPDEEARASLSDDELLRVEQNLP